MEKTTIEYGATKFNIILDRIKNGEIKIPPFQRTFDWSGKDMERFYNSIVKGEPFGSIMLWTDNSNKSSILQTNPHFNKLSKNHSSKTNKTYLIDGQQRVTTFAILYLLHNNEEYNAKNLKKPESIQFDIEKKEFFSGEKRKYSIPEHNFFTNNFKDLRKLIFNSIINFKNITDENYTTDDLNEDVYIKFVKNRAEKISSMLNKIK